MKEHVLITGGAGFIGRAVARALLENGCRVRVLDALIPQVHPRAERPEDLPPEVELVIGDVRDGNCVRKCLQNVDSVIHLAAEVGVGQSMYAIERYTSVNEVGTAVLFEQLLDHPLRRIVTASSMSIYGEGLYRAAGGELHENVERGTATAGFDPCDAQGRALEPVPTPESKRPVLASVYAIGKYVQERLTLTLSRAYGMEGCALRLWNVYGPGQALSNPYTGVLAIFASRIANGQPPLVFEDGRQRRDFVHVRDVAQAFLRALDTPAANGEVFNIASGQARSIETVARDLARAMQSDIEPRITHERRTGDIRHCLADIGKAERLLGFAPREDYAAALAELAQWVTQQEAQDHVDQARRELNLRGLVA